MAFTHEQRQKALETRAHNKAAREQARLATVDTPAPEVADAEPEAAASEDVLKQLAGLFAQASGQKDGRDKAINEAIDVLGKLDPLKYPDIASNQAVLEFVDRVQSARARSANVPPGTIIGTGIAAHKKEWTNADLLKSKDMDPDEAQSKGLFPWVIYTPIRTTYVGWNGLHVYFLARRKIYTPKCFVDVFEQSLDSEEFAEQHAAWLFNTPGVPYQVDFGNGSNGPRVKAMDMGTGEYYNPGGGLIDLTPDPNLVALGGGTSKGEE